MVSQVPIVGIMMIVNGALAGIMGLGLAVMGPLMFTLVNMDGRQRGGMRADEENLITFMSILYLAIGLAVLASGVLNVIGGIRALKYRGRTFVLTALFVNLIPVLTCYCTPTSMGLMIYGLIVMFQADVTRAFSMGEDGLSPEEIRRRFTYRMDSYRDRDDDYYEEERDRPRQLPPPKPKDSDFPPGDDRYK